MEIPVDPLGVEDLYRRFQHNPNPTKTIGQLKRYVGGLFGRGSRSLAAILEKIQQLGLATDERDAKTVFRAIQDHWITYRRNGGFADMPPYADDEFRFKKRDARKEGFGLEYRTVMRDENGSIL